MTIQLAQVLGALGIQAENSGTFAGKWFPLNPDAVFSSESPVNGQAIAGVARTSALEYDQVVGSAQAAFATWRLVPAPKRGEILRDLGTEFRRSKQMLGALISYEVGKILAEGEGEVQEVIDVIDFSLGLSRQLYGATMHSERPHHRMYEQWHPLGPIGVITAFNFPAAVWAWNAVIAAVCGNSVIWKPSELTPLTSLAVTRICELVMVRHGIPGVFSLVTGEGSSLGQLLATDRRIPLISATGSCGMGRSVGEAVARRLGKSLLELGGNNAVIVLKDANLDLAVRGVVFAAVGTAGQRCTSTRRVLVEKDIEPEFTSRLIKAYQQVRVGNPLEDGILMGPLIAISAVNSFRAGIEQAEREGGKILYGGKVLTHAPSPHYVEPTIIQANADMPIVRQETFAPILYIIPVRDLSDAIRINNDVPHGLASAIFTKSLSSSEQFLSHSGSDCGIANVNIGTSGAEIGGAFGGEKDSGGGREAGSDSWKAYMRRQTNTINWGNDLPLAQGIRFE